MGAGTRILHDLKQNVLQYCKIKVYYYKNVKDSGNECKKEIPDQVGNDKLQRRGKQFERSRRNKKAESGNP
jgi:RNA-binding protein YhbY